MHTPEALRYRPEIDGLRAVAVISVLLFHAGIGCPGGFVGVDVFFVISGFLITSLVRRDLDSGCFTFLDFWERRARRIVPALLVVTLATLFVGWFLLLPTDLEDLGRATAAQSVFAANIHYRGNTGYFSGAADEKPLLHTWSLSVEEQFYLLAPVLLLGLAQAGVIRSRVTACAVLLSLVAASFAASVSGAEHDPSAAFYLLPSRAWELLLGSLVAFVPVLPHGLRHRIVAEFAAVAGLVLILLPVFTYTPETPFPGLAAVPPCLGAALVIWGSGRSAGDGITLAGALLSVRPLVFVGLVSYSLYLWHWPILAYSKYVAIAPWPVGYRAALLMLAFVLAIASWRYVEVPFRTRKAAPATGAAFGFTGAGLALVLACGLLTLSMEGFPQRFPVRAQELANAKFDRAFIRNHSIEDVRSGRLTLIGVADPRQRPAILVWGDSHAMAALPAVDAYLKERGLTGRAATHSSTAPVVGWFKTSRRGLDEEAIAFGEAILSYVETEQIPHVILCGYWKTYAHPAEATESSFGAALTATVRRLVAAGSQPWVLLDVPDHSFDVPTALSRTFYSPSQIAEFCSKPALKDELEACDPRLISEIVSAGGRILNPKPSFLDPSGSHYVVQTNGVVLYRDRHHLTTKGAVLMLLPLFRESLLGN